jgi:hypothetical protein
MKAKVILGTCLGLFLSACYCPKPPLLLTSGLRLGPLSRA